MYILSLHITLIKLNANITHNVSQKYIQDFKHSCFILGVLVRTPTSNEVINAINFLKNSYLQKFSKNFALAFQFVRS